jgi:hypothetical protein
MKKATVGWLFCFSTWLITCWQLQKLGQQEQQRQKLVQKRLPQEREQQERQQELLFYRKQPKQQQRRGSPTGAIFSCQFSL